MEDYLWNDFEVWADLNGVSLEHEIDWEPWWECWKSAIECKNQQLLERPAEPLNAKKEIESCPHADPFIYCETCKVSPCPLGLDKPAE